MNQELDRNRIPRHIAIIMDGNGRWASERGKERTFGHQAGVDTVRTITSECTRLGVKFLTLYTFSMENWNRPPKEVTALMALLVASLEEEIFMKNNVRFRVIGDRSLLPKEVNDVVYGLEKRTENNTAMTAVIALSYSSRWELTKAMNDLAQEVAEGKIKPGDISEQTISEHLETSFMPDPDLLIRTGGELRISNYLLWQIAYSELYFCDTYWPDFDEAELHKAIIDYQSRQRRFGKTEEQVEQEEKEMKG
jgi:undecaprenyl diphosphate synthase